MVDEHFRMSEADGAAYDVEHLLNVKLRGDHLEKFISEWETILSGIKHGEQPDEIIKHTLVLRELRESHVLKDYIRDYERLEVGSDQRNSEAHATCSEIS